MTTRHAAAATRNQCPVAEVPAVVDAGGGIVLGTAGRQGAVVLGAGGSAIGRAEGGAWSWARCDGRLGEIDLSGPPNDPCESVWVEASPS